MQTRGTDCLTEGFTRWRYWHPWFGSFPVSLYWPMWGSEIIDLNLHVWFIVVHVLHVGFVVSHVLHVWFIVVHVLHVGFVVSHVLHVWFIVVHVLHVGFVVSHVLHVWFVVSCLFCMCISYVT